MVNSFKLTCKLENIFMNSVSIQTNNINPIDHIWYGFNKFPCHINKMAMDKLKKRQLKNGIGNIWYDSIHSKIEVDEEIIESDW